ncbi:hypothetical protein BABINDRAFT_159227 [Babjeviella inositovora NRRL Y-12698]|uniref:AMP-dependent synthetase/ligase domain-containing protein n=1 Tax=Babjeviella inositovora NRRL Y-12698 TaxID=984486 RepID=A0A1E3R035_9ASCO|nr:uncharacterized protein BABINDRAFT_159227 [Babjeviella inositovora NRRL Y-12698]ODQ82702.1 hypothetical protein BABINDRAFT_159227 [Babjeviella inositovora NRRL Y-12698]
MPESYPTTFPPNFQEKTSVREYTQTQLPLDHVTIKGNYQVPNTTCENGSPVFRNKLCQSTKGNHLVTSVHPRLTTLYDVFNVAMESYPTHNCLGSKTPSQKAFLCNTFAEVGLLRDQFGAGIMSLMKGGLSADQDDSHVITFYAPNCLEWIVADLSCVAYGIPTAPLYDTLGPGVIEHIVETTQSLVMLLSPAQLSSVLHLAGKNKLSSTKVLILTDIADLLTLSLEVCGEANRLSIKLVTFTEVCVLGSLKPMTHIPPTPDTLYTISFTSGTVGMPKGVELTHQNAIAGIATLYTTVTKPSPLYTPASNCYRSLCFLPLAHVFQKLIFYFELSIGGTIYLPSVPNDLNQIFKDIALIKPTHMVGVPRVFNRIESGIARKLETANLLTKIIYQKCIIYKDQKFMDGKHVTNHWLYDRRFTHKIKAVLGLENVRLMATGSAPMLPETIQSMRYLLNTEVVQGYGLTESFGPITVQLANDEINPVSSGFISATTEFQLRDYPENNYIWKKNRSGELYLRGPQITARYYKDPEKTKESISADGWYRTGDIATLDELGRVRVVDRAKNIFKLSFGEYISPEKVENVYLKSNASLMTQVYVYGDPLQSFLVAIVVLQENACLELLQRSLSKVLAKIRFMDESNMTELNSNVDLRRLLLRHMNKNAFASGSLNGMERLKNIKLFFNHISESGERNSGENYGFTVENGLLTPTLKTKRMNARARFSTEFEEMYAEGDLTV